ncbi:NACHT, LRR and PYD domains-containing protein 10-like [Dysidea avara]|uniref:NACHT, LRR and PYD domains-containing protein 10-like n=1 Tax=Dysidea avara TaxID=196820 RepID=UPI00332497AB
MATIPIGKTGNDRPTERDFNIHVVPNYATKWRELGALLGLASSKLDIIEYDHPHSCEERCKAVLRKWLKIDVCATWGKLVEATAAVYLSSGNVSAHVTTEVLAVLQLSHHVKGVYKQTRFDVGKDTWPLEPPKDFTPIVLVHYEEQHTLKDSITITKVVHTGSINSVISAASDQSSPSIDESLREALQTSKVTKNVVDILVHFEQCDSPQTILIEGAPGIGKSILMKHIAYCWAEGRVMNNFKLLLLICLRDPRVQKASSIKQLLQSFYHRNMDVAKLESCDEALLQDNGKFLVLLLDGYDEFPEGLRENSLIAGILDRQVLPECGLIVSSRPHASLLLHAKADLRADILGFTSEEQEHFIQQSLKKTATQNTRSH